MQTEPSNRHFLKFLRSTTSFIILCLFIVLIFKGCSAIFGPSDQDKEAERFLANLPDDEKLIITVLNHCKLQDEANFQIRKNLLIPCRKAYEVIYSKFLNDSMKNKRTIDMIEAEKSNWIIKLASYNISSGTDIDFFLNALTKNVHHCVASTKTFLRDKEGIDYTKSCIDLTPICLDAAYNQESVESLIFCGSYTHIVMSVWFKEVLEQNQLFPSS